MINGQIRPQPLRFTLKTGYQINGTEVWTRLDRFAWPQ